MQQSQSEKNLMPVGIRIFLIILAYTFIGGIFQLIGYLFAGIPVEYFGVHIEMTIPQILILQFFTFLGVILVVYVFRKFVDKKTFLSIGLSFKNRFSDLLTGFIMALAILGVGFLILYPLKYLEISEINFNIKTLSLSFLLYVFIALSEEFLVRGYMLNNLMDVMNKYVALIISSVIFAFFHVFNPNLSWLGVFNLFIASILLGAAYIYTRNLWFPISLHLFWNFIQGPILGFNVSGMNKDTLMTLNPKGSDIITGGSFGFEGSILCTILSTLSIISILYYFNRKQLRPKARQADVLFTTRSRLIVKRLDVIKK